MEIEILDPGALVGTQFAEVRTWNTAADLSPVANSME